MRIHGVDFTSSPRRAKPITVASGVIQKEIFHLQEIARLESFVAFEEFLRSKGPWIGGFDLPFALPAELLRDLKWPREWRRLVPYCSSLKREDFRRALDLYRASRPVGRKYAHRATDLPAGSSSPMKLVNPPVALMFHEGAPRLLAAGLHIPALADGDRSRIALEAYPGLLVRKQLGIRVSYKSDARSGHTPARKAARRDVMKALLEGKPLGVVLKAGAPLRKTMIDDGSGDTLDAAICAVQAAWASTRKDFGFPPRAFRGEGWIVSA